MQEIVQGISTNVRSIKRVFRFLRVAGESEGRCFRGFQGVSAMLQRSQRVSGEFSRNTSKRFIKMGQGNSLSFRESQEDSGMFHDVCGASLLREFRELSRGSEGLRRIRV